MIYYYLYCYNPSFILNNNVVIIISVDYIMIGEEDENGVESIIIDEKKEKSPYRLRRSDGITHQLFPDHNVMSSVINWVQEEENTQKIKQL